jgi:hypothetical protein
MAFGVSEVDSLSIKRCFQPKPFLSYNRQYDRFQRSVLDSANGGAGVREVKIRVCKVLDDFVSYHCTSATTMNTSSSCG